MHQGMVHVQPVARSEEPAVIGMERFIVMLGAVTEIPKPGPDRNENQHGPE